MINGLGVCDQVLSLYDILLSSSQVFVVKNLSKIFSTNIPQMILAAHTNDYSQQRKTHHLKRHTDTLRKDGLRTQLSLVPCALLHKPGVQRGDIH